ncbi:MAG: UDP-N-acetylmuramoyl-L-alanyl-D-glutamate--2,6-diaminopimelate ligase [Fimbriimonadaceae bacterium]|nr:UDP-N-acetylmuramoyl-L-alanyl-D-glutamate--2,6-diaminopimelate ligase [Fimbriimonadaceae bacterium]
MIAFAQLFRCAGVKPAAISGDATIESLVADSRVAGSGALFVCMPSANTDSHQFLAPAQMKGAVAALAHTEAGFQAAVAAGMAAAWVPAGSFQDALWRIVRAFHGSPTRGLRLVGVTGTNGKTTTAWIVRDALNALGRSCAYLGTLGLTTPAGARTLENTTPFSVELNDLILEVVRGGADTLAMEVSSHALEERRADGLEFDVATFTNLTQDHLDYHGSMEAYAASKRRLFFDLPTQTTKPFRAAINTDDPVGARWASSLDSCVSYGFASGDLRGAGLEVRVDGLSLGLDYRGQTAMLQTRLAGHFNLSNCLAAAATLAALGYTLEECVHGLAQATPVPGRFESIPNDRGVGVIVDYAHTPDALEKLLDSARRLTEGRLIAVFGCGGDRDRKKRPLMARAVSERADVSVLTSDNPRTEDPQQILADVRAGLVPGAESLEIVDRPEAIARAVGMARAGDVVVIAGKGHEDYQILGRTKHPMDDRKLAREALGVGS